MTNDYARLLTAERNSTDRILADFLNQIESGTDWPEAVLETMAAWTMPAEDVEGRTYNYVVGGEAFDWLVLAERLCGVAGSLIPRVERDALLFEGRLPGRFDRSRFKDLLGVDKYRGYLNFFYGVVVEEALQHAVEREVHKRLLGNGNQYQEDFSKEAFSKIYHESKRVLGEQFQGETGLELGGSVLLTELKEFTYWLFKYRMRTADKAKIASDTRKGLEQLREINRRYDFEIGPF